MKNPFKCHFKLIKTLPHLVVLQWKDFPEKLFKSSYELLKTHFNYDKSYVWNIMTMVRCWSRQPKPIWNCAFYRIEKTLPVYTFSTIWFWIIKKSMLLLTAIYHTFHKQFNVFCIFQQLQFCIDRWNCIFMTPFNCSEQFLWFVVLFKAL